MGVLTKCALVVLWAFSVPLCFGSGLGDYFGQTPPGWVAEVFAPGIISLDDRYEYGCHFSNDGKQFGFTVTNGGWDWFQIYLTTQDANGVWSEPVVPDFCLGFQNLYPYFSVDDQTLFFSSPRPSLPPWPVDLYQVQWDGGTWGTAQLIPEPASTGRLDYHPTVTDDGTIYYNAGGLHRSRLVEGTYTEAERLPAPINDGNPTGTPWIAPDESYLVFESGRPGGYGRNDLYISFRSTDDRWSVPLNLGPEINTGGIEDSGFVTRDGKYFFFCRRAAYVTSIPTDIYWIDARAVLPDPNGPIFNPRSGRRFGSLQCAIRYARSGDSLLVSPGVYRESLQLEKDIVIQSSEPNDPYFIGATILEGQADSPVVTLSGNSAACKLAGLTIRAGSVGIVGVATHAIIQNCRVMDNSGHGIELSEASSPHLKDCLITANGQSGIFMHGNQQGGRRNPQCEPLIESCTVVDNGGSNLVGGQPVILNSLIPLD